MKKQKILKLRPTQMAFGLKEACAKTKELKKLSAQKRKKFINDNLVKVLIGPTGELHIVDHHHLAYSLLQLGIKKVGVQVEADFAKRKLSESEFLMIMKKNCWIHLFDQMGRGPNEPVYLPPDIRGMADDPYRSLVWAVKMEGAIGDSKEKFYEFKWAQLLRKNKLLKNRSEIDFKLALRKALKICISPAAQNLPGFIGKKA